MGIYSYQASDGAAEVMRGTLIADTPREARNRLRDQGLSVLEVEEDATSSTPQGSTLLNLLGKAACRRPDTSGFLRELATLLEVGAPMLEALGTALHPQRGGLNGVLLRLRERVATGASLAEAMGEARLHGRPVFDEVTVAMTQVGEDAGNLGDVLNEVALYAERGRQFKNRLTSALAYPAVVLLTGLGVSVFLMTYVVPGLLESLTESGRPLPWITRVVKGGSDFLVGYGWVFAIASGASIAAGVLVHRSPRGRYKLHGLLLRLPGVGDVIRKQAVVRISFVLSTLIRSGVGFERAIGIAQRSTQNLVLRRALKNCETAVHEGRDLGPALESSGSFPGAVVQVFTLGQASGRLEDMLDRLADSYHRQVNTLTDRLTALIEPVLILVLAVVVGAIAFATILPILEIGNAL
ncbi:MAG: type II secretion system F family protein [Planctomycetota bacterium]